MLFHELFDRGFEVSENLELGLEGMNIGCLSW